MKYEKKFEERVVPGSKGRMKRKVEIGCVELVRKSDGKTVSAREGERRVPVDKQVSLVFRRGETKHFTVKVGDEIGLFSRKYQIVSFSDDPKNPEVKVKDILANTETTVTSNGKK